MTSRDFCYWLQGFVELQQAGRLQPRPHDAPEPDAPSLNAAQTACVVRHLALVFKHEIDPSAGAPAHQFDLSQLHNGLGQVYCAPQHPKAAEDAKATPSWQQGPRPDGTQVRC